jgi:hypothetical protein
MMQPAKYSPTDQASEESSKTAAPKMPVKSSIQLLQETIQLLFQDLNKVNIENLLSFWLTLSLSDNEMSANRFDSFGAISSMGSTSPTTNFYLKEPTINYLIETLLNYPFMTVKLWYLSFKTLTSLFQPPPNTNSASTRKIALSLAQNQSLYKFVYKFLSSNHDLVGDECCQSMTEFLKKFSESLAEVNDPEAEFHFKKRLLDVLCMSIDTDGCVSKYQGPVDGQVTFVEFLMGEDLLKCYDYYETDELDQSSKLGKFFQLNSLASVYVLNKLEGLVQCDEPTVLR